MGSTRNMVGTAAFFTVAVGCSLDVTGTGLYGAPDDGGAPPSSDAAGGGPASDVSIPEDAQAEAAPGFDAASVLDSAAPCDLDRDGHQAVSCGGDDCCDNDARAHPGATDWQSVKDACGSFDYDCNGQEEKQTPVANCHVTLGCQGTGFDQDTACGLDGQRTVCFGLFTCNSLHDTQTQKCR
jgi:hypothetical protein